MMAIAPSLGQNRSMAGTELSFLILHGFGYDGDPGHWHSRLARHLAARGHRVAYPRLPDPDEPSLDSWLGVLAEELAGMGEGERVAVCHSLGCLLWIHGAPALAQPVDRLLLVSPPDDDEVPEPAARFRLGRFDVAAVRASSRSAPRVVRGENDPYSPGGMPPWVARARCEAETLAGAEHINPDDGFGPWPAVERWCEDGSARFGG
jgi:predicted alpha/beta hydrolase family esterase